MERLALRPLFATSALACAIVAPGIAPERFGQVESSWRYSNLIQNGSFPPEITKTYHLRGRETERVEINGSGGGSVGGLICGQRYARDDGGDCGAFVGEKS